MFAFWGFLCILGFQRSLAFKSWVRVVGRELSRVHVLSGAARTWTQLFPRRALTEGPFHKLRHHFWGFWLGDKLFTWQKKKLIFEHRQWCIWVRQIKDCGSGEWIRRSPSGLLWLLPVLWLLPPVWVFSTLRATTGYFSLCPLGDRTNIQSKQRFEPQTPGSSLGPLWVGLLLLRWGGDWTRTNHDLYKTASILPMMQEAGLIIRMLWSLGCFGQTEC